MNTTSYEKAEKIKKIILNSAEQSKKTIRDLVVANDKYIDSALDANAQVFKTIKEKLDQQNVDGAMSEKIKGSFSKSVELAEDTLDAIINAYTRQMQLTVDFNTKLVEAVQEANPENADKFLQLINDNFDATQTLINKNTKEIMDFYNKHTNLALNFNKKFEETINAQIDSLFQIQNKGLKKFTGWASEWWKQETPEKVPA
ncbi:MAG TPA: hypothetical protein VII99_03125 [Bacteroidia bacterium]